MEFEEFARRGTAAQQAANHEINRARDQMLERLKTAYGRMGQMRAKREASTADEREFSIIEALVAEARGWQTVVAFCYIIFPRIEINLSTAPGLALFVPFPNQRDKFVAVELLHSCVLGPDSITCLLCGRTSHNPNDVQRRFCGHCRLTHVAPAT